MTTTPRARDEARRARRAATERVLRPGLRRWAYGVTAAAVGLAVALGWLPVEASPVVLVLAMAVFYVDKSGAPIEQQGASDAASQD